MTNKLKTYLLIKKSMLDQTGNDFIQYWDIERKNKKYILYAYIYCIIENILFYWYIHSISISHFILFIIL